MMVTKEQWRVISDENDEAEAGRIVREHLNPQLVRGRIAEARGFDEAAMVNLHDARPGVVQRVMAKAKDAGWKPVLDGGVLFLKT